MKAFIERIEMFPEKRKDGSWIKKIVFNFPVPVDGEEVKELPLENETTVEKVLVQQNISRHSISEIAIKIECCNEKESYTYNNGACEKHMRRCLFNVLI